MAGELLLDTGALTSLLDRSQGEHASCVGYFERWTNEIVTTEAILIKPFTSWRVCTVVPQA